MKRFLPLIFLLLLHVGAGATDLDTGFLPPEHWAYSALERLEAMGLCNLPDEKPFTRPEVIIIVSRIVDEIAREQVQLSSRDKYNLERLKREFFSASSRSDPRNRYDPPIVFLSDAPLYLESDLDLALVPKNELSSNRTDFFLVGHPGMKLHISDFITYEVRYELTFGPERGDRARNNKPSSRERSFKGLTSLFERSYVLFHKKNITFFFGRDYVDWGPSDWGNLILSENAGSLDQIGFRLSLKNFTISMIHSPLSIEKERHLAAHRLEMRWPRILIGVSEAVVYTRRGFDPVYALPLASFYSNQFNEKGDDNILWSVDIKCRPAKMLLLYGSLLVDDFQFERDDNTPDKLGFDVGCRLATTKPIPLTVRARYRYIDIYTYTHRDSMSAYIGGDGLPQLGDPLLGGVQGPDSDAWRIDVTVYPLENFPVTQGFFGMRHGEGDFKSFHPGDDPFPPFPSGVVERTLGVNSRLTWELNGGSRADFSFVWEHVRNRGHVVGDDVNNTAFCLSLLWDF